MGPRGRMGRWEGASAWVGGDIGEFVELVFKGVLNLSDGRYRRIGRGEFADIGGGFLERGWVLFRQGRPGDVVLGGMGN